MRHISRNEMKAYDSFRITEAATAKPNHKTKWTTDEAREQNIASVEPYPEKTPCRFCGKMLDHEGLFLLGFIRFWRKEPLRCDCEKAQAYWAERDRLMELETKQKEEEERRKMIEKRTQFLIKKSGVPERYLERRFETYITEENSKKHYALRSAIRFVQGYKEELKKKGQSIYFYGNSGNGKTHLACAIAIALCEQGEEVLFKPSVEMFSELKAGFQSNSDSIIIEDLKHSPLLIIDDLGKEKQSEYSVCVLFEILNYRYEHMLPTIITSNYTLDELQHKLHFGDDVSSKAIVSRLSDQIYSKLEVN